MRMPPADENEAPKRWRPACPVHDASLETMGNTATGVRSLATGEAPSHGAPSRETKEDEDK
jgi:hypothetical protein